MNRKLVPLFVLSLTFLNACGGGGSSTNGGGGTGPQPISLTFAELPPSSMMTGSNVGVSATVTNDSKNAGVTWTCTPMGTCGTFNPTSTPSGNPTTYTAPSTVPSGGTVTLTATSVTDTTKTATAQVTITAPPPPAISVSISQAPAATLSVSGTTTVAATTNDSAGVSWTCAPANSCGSFSPPSTLTTVTTTYTAPASAPAGGGMVTLTATSVTDATKTATASVLITGVASNALLKGQYAFIVSAPTGNATSRGITTWVGSVDLDGQGNIATVGQLPYGNPPHLVPAGGVEDLVSPHYYDLDDPIYPTASNPTSAYSVDPSGHGTLIISTYNGETLHISFVLTSVTPTSVTPTTATHALVIELDGEPGSGSIDLQTPASGGFAASQISGAYSFTMEGIDFGATTNMVSFGGLFNASSSSITSGTIDVNSIGAMHVS